MPRFKYVAMDGKGQEGEGVLDAANQQEAIAVIRANGYFPTKIVEIGVAATGAAATTGAAPKKKSAVAPARAVKKSPGKQIVLFKKRVKPKELMTITRQMATLVNAGLPLLRGLRILLQQEKNPTLREALGSMGESVEGGSTFSESLASHPKLFDKLYVNMVRAGEAGGVLDVVLTRLADFMEKGERVKQKVKGAMVYPCVVLTAALGIVAFMLTKVIPKFAEIFKELLDGAQLPALTQFVINASDLLRQNGIGVVIFIALVVTAVKMWYKTVMGRFLLDRFKLRMPMFGDLILKTAVARFSRTLGTLLSSGVPILQALMIVRDTASNAVIEKAIQKVHDSVKEGDTMAMPMAAAGVFPNMVISMVEVGEETGALPDMLMRVADGYDEEVDMAVESLTSIIEPIMIMMLAGIIGTLVVAMFMPMISIITKMGD